eukprot:SAG22_NODE_11443_length_485_cov_0.660622_1_plen_86_part_00
MRENGCPWDKEVIGLATQQGHTEVVGWARAIGCPEPESGEDSLSSGEDSLSFGEDSLSSGSSSDDGAVGLRCIVDSCKTSSKRSD